VAGTVGQDPGGQPPRRTLPPPAEWDPLERGNSSCAARRSGRVAQRGGLENHCTERYGV